MLKILTTIFFQKHIFFFIVLPIIILSSIFAIFYFKGYEAQVNQLFHFNDEQQKLRDEQLKLRAQLDSVNKQFQDFKSVDQVKVNETQKSEIKNIHDSYNKA